MVLGKLPVLFRKTVGHGPIPLAVGAVGVVWTFFSHISFLSSFSMPVGDGPI